MIIHVTVAMNNLYRINNNSNQATDFYVSTMLYNALAFKENVQINWISN